MNKSLNESDIWVLPVPWDLTCSYHDGCSMASSAILKVSNQLDFYHSDLNPSDILNIAMLPVDQDILAINNTYKRLAKEIMSAYEHGCDMHLYKKSINAINSICKDTLYKIQKKYTEAYIYGKKVILLGGDHSVSLAAIHAFSEQGKRFGVLQIDAHMDLRKDYHGFTYSHASVMYQTLKLREVETLVQVGIRDFCKEEFTYAKKLNSHFFTDQCIRFEQFEGRLWAAQVNEIISLLPENVYVTIDIDGLDPALCPGTGTPVPGGLSFQELHYLLLALKQSKKNILGVDLVEVSPCISQSNNSWDANVGARVLYLLGLLVA